MAANKEQIDISCEDGNKLKLLVYRPEKASDSLATGVLWIHGGGYITGMASMAGMMGMGSLSNIWLHIPMNSESAAIRFLSAVRVQAVDSVPLSVCWPETGARSALHFRCPCIP